MEKPKFKVVEETPYGPRLERIASEPAQKEEVKKGMSRRNFLGGLAMGAGALAGGVLLNKFGENEHEQESIEEISGSENFDSELEGYKALTQLAKDEIIFVDERNVPVGGPVKFQDFIDKKYDKEGNVAMEAYRFSPAKTINHIGIPKEGLVTEWAEYVQGIVQKQYPGRHIVGFHHVYQDIQKAYQEKDEPELVRKIADGEVTRYIDVVQHFAAKPVVGSEHMNRMEYVQNKIIFEPFVPDVIQHEIRRLISGLCSEESRFNAGLVSASGAKGIMQFKPLTWSDYSNDPKEMLSLMKQVEAAGKHFSDIYKWLTGGRLVSNETLAKFFSKFQSEEDFNRDFLVPVMINAYNTGVGTASKWINAYADAVPVENMKTGKDLFLDMAEFGFSNKSPAEYGIEARRYVTKVYAQAEVLNGSVERYT